MSLSISEIPQRIGGVALLAAVTGLAGCNKAALDQNALNNPHFGSPPIGSKLDEGYPSSDQSFGRFANTQITTTGMVTLDPVKLNLVASMLKDSSARNDFDQLVNKTVGERPALLFCDKAGNTLLCNLATLACTEDLHPNLVASREAALHELIRLALGTQVITQADHNTCGAGSILLTVNSCPEISRLALGMLGHSGKVEMAGGGILQRVSDSIEPDSSAPRRGLVQRLLQSALMDYGNGPLAEYSNRRDGNVVFGIAIPGLMPEGARTTLSQLTGASAKLESRLAKVSAALDQENAHVMTLIHLKDIKYHWIVLRKLEGGRYFYLEPNGDPDSSIGVTHNSIAGYEYRSEDTRYALFSISRADFEKHFVCAVLLKK